MSFLALFGLQKIEKCVHDWITDYVVDRHFDANSTVPYKTVKYQQCSKCGKERKKVYK